MDILEKPITDLYLSTRAYNALSFEDIKTVGDLIEFSKEDLLKAENFGRKSLKEVVDALEKLGLRLMSYTDKDHAEEQKIDLKSEIVKLKETIRIREHAISKCQEQISKLTDNVIYVQKQRDQALQTNESLFKLMNNMMEKRI